MDHIQQPRGSRLCGQACIAMACNVTLERAIRLIGHSHGTRTKEVVLALRAMGWVCPDRLQLTYGRMYSTTGYNFPERCIVKVSDPNSNHSHWMLVWDHLLHDPETESGGPPRAGMWPATSFLRLEHRNPCPVCNEIECDLRNNLLHKSYG